MTFETRPLTDLPRRYYPDKNSDSSRFLVAIGELPADLAMFVPAGGRTLRTVSSLYTNGFMRKYPGRRLHARSDKEKDGVWFWWEPKP